MRYSIKMNFDTDKGREELLAMGIETQRFVYGHEDTDEVKVGDLTDESHIKGMEIEITEAFGVPGKDGIAGFTSYEVILED